MTVKSAPESHFGVTFWEIHNIAKSNTISGSDTGYETFNSNSIASYYPANFSIQYPRGWKTEVDNSGNPPQVLFKGPEDNFAFLLSVMDIPVNGYNKIMSLKDLSQSELLNFFRKMFLKENLVAVNTKTFTINKLLVYGVAFDTRKGHGTYTKAESIFIPLLYGNKAKLVMLSCAAGGNTSEEANSIYNLESNTNQCLHYWYSILLK